MNLYISGLLFLIYSFIGWVLEIIGEFLRHKKFINRGFLIGPYCPIYGFGCLGIVIIGIKYRSDPFALFVMAMLICSLLEYFTSLIMELLFKTRWWDYSDKKFNINGRICLETTIPFGMLGLILVYLINPILVNIIKLIPYNIGVILTVILMTSFLIDVVVSFLIILNLRTTIKTVRGDSTNEITSKVRIVLLSKNILHRRLIKAFPHLKALQHKFKGGK